MRVTFLIVCCFGVNSFIHCFLIFTQNKVLASTIFVYTGVLGFVSYRRARYVLLSYASKKGIKFVFVVCLGSSFVPYQRAGPPTITTLARANRANRGRRGGKVKPSCRLPATRGISQRSSRDDPNND